MYWGPGGASQAISHGLAVPKTIFPGLAANFRYLLKLPGELGGPAAGRA